MISTGNNMLKWGILLSILHIYIYISALGLGVEILPAFVGYFLIMKGTYGICNESQLDYMQPLKAESTRLFIFSCIYWISGLFLGYYMILQKFIMIIFYLFDVLFFGNLLNKMVKYYKEKMRMAEADKLRTFRMTFIKSYLALIIFYMITILPNILSFLKIGSADFISLISNILSYIFLSLMLILKLWLSMLVQKYTI